MEPEAFSADAASEDEAAPVGPEDEKRASTYGLLGALLARPPGAEVLEALRGIEAGGQAEGDMAPTWDMLRLAAGYATTEGLDDEYHELFIGISRGELVPYGSWYLTGFMMDRPLAYLRRDLQQLGIERQAGVAEPEDHASALCEAMAVIISSAPELDAGAQREFFQQHVAPWMGLFFKDLQQARAANFYRAVGRLGEQFIEFERRYLAMSG
ncbi:MAG: molecular chaperone TorD family protein [Gammaproteobacteria bacterium]